MGNAALENSQCVTGWVRSPGKTALGELGVWDVTVMTLSAFLNVAADTRLEVWRSGGLKATD